MSYAHAAKMCVPVLGGAMDIVFGEEKAPVALASPPPKDQPQQPVSVSKKDLQKQYAVAAAAAIAGAVLWKEHRVLGFLAGGAVGDAGYRVWRNKGDDRNDAMYMVGVTAAAVGGSMVYKQQPALGYVGGMVAGLGAAYFLPNSPVKRYHQAMQAGTAPKGLLASK